jgi:hypothetical protein
MTVCHPYLTALPHLFTAYADQGQRLIIGSRPVDIVVRDEVNVLEGTDQLGRACNAELLSSKFPCSYSTSKSLPSFLVWILVALITFCLVNCAAAAATPAASAAPAASAMPAASLSLFALNTNGFVHPMKIDATNRAISHRNPGIVVITKTKTNTLGSSKMSYTDYQFFEERGTPTVGHHLFKWGVILGVKKGITVSQRVAIDNPTLAGRLIAVDIVIPLDTGQGFIHRIFAVYAPWDVGDNADTVGFWHEVSKLCLSTPNSWTLLGDLNATVNRAERNTGGSDARAHFNNFLQQSKGIDLWSNYPERSRFTDWTCKPHTSTDGGSIIDRIVTSSDSLIDSEIIVADGHLDFIPMTDHRPIIGRLILKPPGRTNARCLHDLPTPILNDPRVKFPTAADKHLFQTYRDLTDARIEHAGLHDLPVTDDTSFNCLYLELTEIINTAAVEVFGKVKRKQRDVHKVITNPLIEQLQARSRAIGDALRLDKYPLYAASHAATLIYSLSLAELTLNTTDHPTLRSYLNAKRKAVNKDLYRERSNEVYARAKKFDSYRISQALTGGSTKRLIHTAEFVPLLLSVNSVDGSHRLLSSPDQVKAETRTYWEKLYARQPVPVMEKPWLVTKSVKEVHDRVSANPFQ